jgi:hypothetical protein
VGRHVVLRGHKRGYNGCFFKNAELQYFVLHMVISSYGSSACNPMF